MQLYEIRQVRRVVGRHAVAGIGFYINNNNNNNEPLLKSN